MRHRSWLSLIAAAAVLLGAACSQTTSSATAPADGSATPTATPGVAELLASAELDETRLPQFVLRADDLTGVADNFRVWRDAVIDYEAYEETDPILLSPSSNRYAADGGYVAHLVGRDGLTLVHAISAAELYEDDRAATRGFRSTTESLTDGCALLNLEETELDGVGDQALLLTAIRTCDFGDPASFGAIVVRYGSLITTTVIQRGDRDSVEEIVAETADVHANALASALGGTGLDDAAREPELPTSTFGLCIPDPDAPSTSVFNKNWRELNTDLIRTYTQRSSTADRDRKAIHQTVLDTLAQANAVLGTSYGGPIDIYFYESIEQLQQAAPYTANEVLGFAFGQEVHQLCGGTLDGSQWVNMAMSAHEYTHIITLNLWGRTSSQILIEGLAHYVTVGERDSFAAYHRIEPLPPLASIEDDDAWDGRTWGTLICGFLIEEHGGIEEFKNLWFGARTADLATSVEAIYGMTLDDLDAAIRAEYGLLPAP